MKTFKRIAALALSAVMAVGLLATPAMATSISDRLSSGMHINHAADDAAGLTIARISGSITVMNAESDATYNAYRLFDLNITGSYIRDTDMASEMTNGNEDGDETENKPYVYEYKYTIVTSSPWYRFFSEGPGQEYVDLEKDESYGGAMLDPMDERYIVEPTDEFATEADAAELAGKALAYMKGINWDEFPHSWADPDDIADDMTDPSTQTPQGVLSLAGDAGDDDAEPETNDDEAATRGLEQGQANHIFPWNYHLTVMPQDASVVDLTGYGQSTTGWIAQEARRVRTGYYLVDSTVGSLCAMDSTNYDVVISEKNARSTVTKQVWERGTGVPASDEQWIYGLSDENGTWGTTSNTSVGEDVYFRTVITIGEDSMENLILWDDMSANNFRIKPEEDDLRVYRVDAEGTATEVLWKTDGTANWVVDYCDTNMAPPPHRLLDEVDEEVSGGAILAYDPARDEYRLNDKVNYIGEDDVHEEDFVANYNMNLYGQNRHYYDNGFCVRFMPEFCASLAEGEKLIVTYTAERVSIRNVLKLLGGGETEFEQEMSEYQAGGLNRTYVTCGTENPQMSGVARTYTYDHGFDLVKINSSKEILFGAKFTLKDASGNVVPLVKEEVELGPETDGQGREEYERLVYYRPATQAERTQDFEPAVIEAGRVYLHGLDAGVYTLTETEAPTTEYNIAPPQTFEIVAGKDSNGDLDGSATLTIGSQSNIPLSAELDGEYDVEEELFMGIVPRKFKTLTGGTYVSGGLPIVNLTGAELPSTGGIGTTIFYTVGALLVIGAGILLITKKRMSAE